MKTKALLLFAVLLVCSGGAARAVDFGLVLDQSAGYGGVAGNEDWDYTGVLLPRVSSLLDDFGSLYISAGGIAGYSGGEWAFMPELLRTELCLFDIAELKLGRLYYSDPLGLVADGLFDGIHFTFGTQAGSFSAGAWYTGFLYKKRARITMTGEERLSYYADVDYGDFMGTYFAPRHVVSALDWEHPGLGRLLRTKLSVVAQFSLEETGFHSQYLVGKMSLPLGAFLLDLGGSFEVKETSGDISMAFLAEAGASWVLPTAFGSRFSLLGRYTSGEMGGMGAFSPLTWKSQSSILQAKVPGTSMLYVDYVARLHRAFSLSLSSSYFVRNDLATYTGYPAGGGQGQGGYFLGNEFFGRLYWSSFSDVQLTLGGGIFMPSLGDVAPKLDNIWRVEAGLVISVY